jgi:hypothetical protein
MWTQVATNGGFVEKVGLFFRTDVLSKVYYTLRDLLEEVEYVYSSCVRLFRNHVHVTSPSGLFQSSNSVSNYSAVQ